MATRIVTTDGEWDTEFAAAVDGDVIEVSGTNFTPRTVNRNFGATGLQISSANGSSSLPGLIFDSQAANINVDGLNMQYIAWPRVINGQVTFNSGTYSDITFNASLWRHGYGPSQLNYDPTSQLAEYTRVDNVQTASTVSSTHAISWQDASANEAWVEFFNRGSEDVHVAFGGSGISVTWGGGTLCPAGQRTRITGLNPITDTHFAIVTNANTSEVNARTEIGLYYYAINGFSSSGAASCDNLIIENCDFADLNNGIKGIPGGGGVLVFRENEFSRIYQDCISFGGVGRSNIYVLGNLFDTPFARSGIPENENGDARDPHGDFTQIFGDNSATIDGIYSAGNTSKDTPRRSGATAQGNFWTDNDRLPSYRNIFSISDMLCAQSFNGFQWGENGGWNIDGAMAYGATCLDFASPSTAVARFRHYTATNGQLHVESCIFGGTQLAEIEDASTVDYVALAESADADAVFPSNGTVQSETTRSDIETAMTSAAEGTGIGAVATRNAVNYSAVNYTDFIVWDNVPSGVGWTALVEQPTSSQIVFPKKRILNRKTGQAISADSGVEYQIYDTDGTTVLQAWTSTSGTVEPDEYVQIRKTSPATGGAENTDSVTINGFAVPASITTSQSISNGFRTNGSVYWADPSNVPANTTIIEWEAKYNLNGNPASNTVLMGQESGGDCEILSSGDFRLGGYEDSSQTNVVLSGISDTAGDQTVVQVVNVLVDMDADIFELRIDGELVGSGTLDPAGTGTFQTGREIVFGATSGSGGGTQFPAGADFEYLKVWFTTGGSRTLHKEISVAALGSIANINSDPWTGGGTVSASPDTAAPSVFNAELTTDSDSEVTHVCDVNESGGTLYRYLSTSATPPSNADLIAGTGAVASQNQAIGSTGTQASHQFTGLSASTQYWCHALATDATANESTISTTTTTTSPPNSAPTDITLSNNTIAENTTGLIGTLSATDPDGGDTHTFTLAPGTGDTDNGIVSISGDQLSLDTAVDYETQQTLSIRIQADDGNGGTFDKAFTITVTDVSETPPDTSATMFTPSTFTIGKNTRRRAELYGVHDARWQFGFNTSATFDNAPKWADYVSFCRDEVANPTMYPLFIPPSEYTKPYMFDSGVEWVGRITGVHSMLDKQQKVQNDPSSAIIYRQPLSHIRYEGAGVFIDTPNDWPTRAQGPVIENILIEGDSDNLGGYTAGSIGVRTIPNSNAAFIAAHGNSFGKVGLAQWRNVTIRHFETCIDLFPQVSRGADSAYMFNVWLEHANVGVKNGASEIRYEGGLCWFIDRAFYEAENGAGSPKDLWFRNVEIAINTDTAVGFKIYGAENLDITGCKTVHDMSKFVEVTNYSRNFKIRDCSVGLIHDKAVEFISGGDHRGVSISGCEFSPANSGVTYAIDLEGLSTTDHLSVTDCNITGTSFDASLVLPAGSNRHHVTGNTFEHVQYGTDGTTPLYHVQMEADNVNRLVVDQRSGVVLSPVPGKGLTDLNVPSAPDILTFDDTDVALGTSFYSADGLSAMTWAVWVKFTRAIGNREMIVSDRRSDGSSLRFSLERETDGILHCLVRPESSGGSIRTASATALQPSDEWALVVGTFDSVADEVRLHVRSATLSENVTTSSAMTAYSGTSNAVRLGSYAGTLTLQGAIGQAIQWRGVAATQTQIDDYYNASRHMFGV